MVDFSILLSPSLHEMFPWYLYFLEKISSLSIKDRNSMHPTEAEDNKKRWQEYTEELYKKDLHDPDNHDDVIANLEPDILECEIKWALESIATNNASGGDVIAVQLFQILKMML